MKKCSIFIKIILVMRIPSRELNKFTYFWLRSSLNNEYSIQELELWRKLWRLEPKWIRKNLWKWICFKNAFTSESDMITSKNVNLAKIIQSDSGSSMFDTSNLGFLMWTSAPHPVKMLTSAIFKIITAEVNDLCLSQ